MEEISVRFLANNITCQPHGDQVRLGFTIMLGTEDCGDPMESRQTQTGALGRMARRGLCKYRESMDR